MHCRNCGTEVAEQAVICVACGVPPRTGNKFCQNCATETNPAAEICVGCGVRLARATGAIADGDVSPKSRLAVTLFAAAGWFTFIAGIHRFYLGKIGTGVLMLLTFGGFGVWTLIDIIMAVAGTMKDKDGKLITKW